MVRPERTKQQRKAGRRPYLEALIDDMVRGGTAIGLPEEALRALVVNALSNDARIGGRYGRTLSEAIDMCEKALMGAGIPTEREEVIRLLANPKSGEVLTEKLSHSRVKSKR